jgi:nucleotide-binding universal stress UspA family protein
MESRIITLAEETYSRAQLIKGKLEAAGITCFLTNVNLVQSNVGAGVRIKIDAHDEPRARSILEIMKKTFGEEKEDVVNQLKLVRRILVPVDFSEPSRNAVKYALAIGNVLKSELLLYHVYYSPTVDPINYSEAYSMNINIEKHIRDIYKNARYDMVRLVSEMEDWAHENDFHDVVIRHELNNGIPEHLITDKTASYKPAIVIIGHKGKGEESEKLVGSVTNYIINKIKQPILVVPHTAVFTSMTIIRNIGYATNFDDSDIVSIGKLISLLRPFNMKIHCIHVQTQAPQQWDQIKLKGLKAYFKELDIPDIECKMTTEDNIIKALVEFIKESNIQLLATTTHKRNFFTNLLRPSLTKELLKILDIPVLIFHG